MKKIIPSIAVIALLYSSEVEAVKLRDIFDAYDIESKKELLQTEDDVDPAALTAEINGDQIAKDVKSATAGVADNTMLQMSADLQMQNKSDASQQSLKDSADAVEYIKYNRELNMAKGDGPPSKADMLQTDAHLVQYQPVNQDDIDFKALAKSIPDRSSNEYDGEYVQLTNLAEYVKGIEGPEDLEAVTLTQEKDLAETNLDEYPTFAQLRWERGNNEIYDEDGDGVEDNVSDGWSSWMFDKFYDPAVFHVVEDINNTKHGNLPGMRQKEWDAKQTEPKDTYDIVSDPEWLKEYEATPLEE